MSSGQFAIPPNMGVGRTFSSGKVLFPWGDRRIFFLGGVKVVNFDFTNSKLGGKHFLRKI